MVYIEFDFRMCINLLSDFKDNGMVLISKGARTMNIRKADCCKNCKHVGVDYHFRDAVLCGKTNEYRLHIEVCDLFEMTEREEE